MYLWPSSSLLLPCPFFLYMALLSGALRLPTVTPFTSLHKSHLSFFTKALAASPLRRSAADGARVVCYAAALEEELEKKAEVVPVFRDPRWIGGTWDLKQFEVDGKNDWNTLIDAEARRRKWLEDNPEASSNDEPVVFDTSIIPWWAWIKRFHLPEAERLNGRAAMVGFFMAYVVDSLTGAGLVDQMHNFFCKTLLLIAVGGVLLVRKSEDLDTLRRLLDESTFYDKQWQASWKDDTDSAGTGSKE